MISTMASHSFGHHFRITTWGESHGPAIGVVIDGCPAGLNLDLGLVQHALDRRAPGKHATTSPRCEPDTIELLSGCYEGLTTGTPLMLMIRNRDARAQDYATLKQVMRPGHAHFTYLQKYGVFDHRGGGRASARETACRVAAGAIAEQILAQQGVQILAHLQTLADINDCAYPLLEANLTTITPAISERLTTLDQQIFASAVHNPDQATSTAMAERLETARKAGDSLGGIVAWQVIGAPAGWGEPVYRKLEAELAHAMLSIPASKGFEIGEGFAAATSNGSNHNDGFTRDKDGQVHTTTNHAGGLLGGITTGSSLYGRVAFKPTASIRLPQATVDTEGQPCTMQLSANARHDPCVAIRAVPVVKAMVALVMVDAYLARRLNRLEDHPSHHPNPDRDPNPNLDLP